MEERNPHAILTLYLGLVESVGQGEGRFGEGGWDPNSSNQRVKDFFYACMKSAKEYIEPGLHKGGFRMGYSPLTPTREEAESLVEYSRRNISGSEGIIQLVDQMHGKLRFLRQIRFNRWQQESEDELIKQLKRSGFSPENDSPIREYKLFRDDCDSQEGKDFWQTEIDELADEPWKRALEFYS